MDVYAEPRHDVRLEECHFYHTLDIPGTGRVEGAWEIVRPADYVGNIVLDGRRVLEIGPASGCLTVHMEQAGAEVVAYDLGPDQRPDNLLQGTYDRDRYLEEYRAFQRTLNNSFWFVHQAFGLKARVVYGSVYEIPDAIGEFDVSTFGAVLTHLRDPFRALYEVARRTKENLVVTEMLPYRTGGWQGRLMARALSWAFPSKGTVEPVPLFFRPHRSGDHHQYTWWTFTPESISRMISLLGFETAATVFHTQKWGGKDRKLFTIVGQRAHSGYTTIDKSGDA